MYGCSELAMTDVFYLDMVPNMTCLNHPDMLRLYKRGL
jgi:hypothetical protein